VNVLVELETFLRYAWFSRGSDVVLRADWWEPQVWNIGQPQPVSRRGEQEALSKVKAYAVVECPVNTAVNTEDGRLGSVCPRQTEYLRMSPHLSTCVPPGHQGTLLRHIALQIFKIAF